MARLDEATARLHSAIAHLERAMKAQILLETGSGREAKLLAALDQARQENETLQEVATLVSGRLDDVLSRLKHALDS